MKKLFFLSLLLLAGSTACSAQTALSHGFDHPQDSARTKVWWFFGETETTREGITADLEAFKQQGVGGVVYYDQVHGKGEGADRVFDAHWWQSLIFASQEAKRLGLSFEANIGNGYVAGGKWITPDHSMQRLAKEEQVVSAKGGTLTFQMGLPRCPQGWHHDVAVLAMPYKRELLADSRLLSIEPTGDIYKELTFDFGTAFTARSITYEATGQGKARTSSMQVPPFAPRTDMQPGKGTQWSFYGCGFRELPDIGVLEVSDDGTSYRKVCHLRPKYKNLGGVRQQTVAFPTVRGRYFRIRITTADKVKIENAVVSARACVDEWEEKASLVSEFIGADRTPIYNKVEMVDAADIVDLTAMMASDGTVTWADAPQGEWLVMRFVSVSTGGHTKHGRAEALGLECDKLSVEGARQHWRSYTKPVIDSIRAHGGALEGICMDSHEAGPQNWTQTMEQEFRRLRGYDIRRYLPTIAGGMIVWSAAAVANSSLFTFHSSLLTDLRRTIGDLITDRYYGEINRLCRAEGLTLTAQAIGGALCMAGDAIEVKKLVDKPQGEFWGYQTEGNYDIKECSSAAHVYGKLIASGEAFTDITYKHTLADIKNLADYAYAFGINEFVVCAVAYQADATGYRLNTANGRQYVLNRLNTLWPLSRPFWDYQARCSWMLRQGKPVADVAVYLGDELPARIEGHKLPPLPQGYDFDALGTDALLHRLTARDGRLVLPDGGSYRLLVLPPDGELTSGVRQRIDEWRRQGIAVYDPRGSLSLTETLRLAGMQPDVEAPQAKRLYFCHRKTDKEDIYFLNNHSDEAVGDRFLFRTEATSAELWNPVTGERTPLSITTEQGRTAIDLTMAARESYFVVLSSLGSKPAPNNRQSSTGNNCQSPIINCQLPKGWTVQFDPSVGGPAEPVTFDQLGDWTKHSDPRIRYYSGTAICRSTLSLDKKDRQATYRLRLPLLNSAAEVIVNGRSAGTVWCSPWSIDITKLLRKGKNLLELRIGNTLWNRLVGDANKAEADRVMQQTHPLAKPTDKLVPSGVGPYTIIP
ncbi:MAG: glycosyl hydrolase family 2 [Prevotella sp.]|nr:glycosyl hydrolase family 2 [Prevotella sp.]